MRTQQIKSSKNPPERQERARNQILGAGVTGTWVKILAQALTGCVTVGRFLHLSGYLQNGGSSDSRVAARMKKVHTESSVWHIRGHCHCH